MCLRSACSPCSIWVRPEAGADAVLAYQAVHECCLKSTLGESRADRGLQNSAVDLLEMRLQSLLVLGFGETLSTQNPAAFLAASGCLVCPSLRLRLSGEAEISLQPCGPVRHCGGFTVWPVTWLCRFKLLWGAVWLV